MSEISERYTATSRNGQRCGLVLGEMLSKHASAHHPFVEDGRESTPPTAPITFIPTQERCHHPTKRRRGRDMTVSLSHGSFDIATAIRVYEPLYRRNLSHRVLIPMAHHIFPFFPEDGFFLTSVLMFREADSWRCFQGFALSYHVVHVHVVNVNRAAARSTHAWLGLGWVMTGEFIQYRSSFGCLSLGLMKDHTSSSSVSLLE